MSTQTTKLFDHIITMSSLWCAVSISAILWKSIESRNLKLIQMRIYIPLVNGFFLQNRLRGTINYDLFIVR